MMSNNHQPNQTDRIVSHVIVGLLVGLVVGKQTGKWGFVVGVLAGAGAHELLDAPVANVVADFTS
jgi:F0F1-type ATP synthase assembly protein I